MGVHFGKLIALQKELCFSRSSVAMSALQHPASCSAKQSQHILREPMAGPMDARL
jgi:hypothetical protein